MNVANCPRCGKIYMKNVRGLCPDCQRDDDQMYDKVYRYLRENPRSSVQQVAAATEVPEERVLAYLREGRIQSTESMHIDYPCERCGAMISAGRFCEKCSRDVQTSLQALASQIQSSSQASDKDKKGYHMEDRLKKRS